MSRGHGICPLFLSLIIIDGPYQSRYNNKLPRKRLAQKAIAAGFKGMQVDGNDMLAIERLSVMRLKKPDGRRPNAN